MPALPDSAQQRRLAAASAALPTYLAAAWGITPRLRALPPSPTEADVPARPVLSGDHAAQHALHLPWHAPWGADLCWQQAAASHAAAHWRFGGLPMAREGLKPVQQALVGVLEDARVEWCALQALPGLRSVWVPFHEGPQAAQGNGFEALLARLARSLLNPGYTDPHPWVAKARAMAFMPDGCTPALHSVQAVRHMASLLGNDIGQMRLPFNARTYRVHAAYRDDNSHLWLPDAAAASSDTPLDAGDMLVPGAGHGDDRPAPPVCPSAALADHISSAIGADAVAVYPEWDHVIERFRPRWCHVFATPAEAVAGPVRFPSAPDRQVARALTRLRGGMAQAGQRTRYGDDLHLPAAIDWIIDHRLQRLPDELVYRQVLRPAQPMAVLLLLDASVSTARPAGCATMGTVLDAICQAASAASMALQALGHRTAMYAFASHGRQRIDMPCLQGWSEKAGSGAVQLRLAALHSAGSTRMGAVVRHATALALQDAHCAPGWRRAVVLVTDGEPYDIDVHDPAYLLADLKKAALSAADQGIGLGALVLSPGRPEVLAHALGARSCAPWHDAAELPTRLLTLLQGMQ